MIFGGTNIFYSGIRTGTETGGVGVLVAVTKQTAATVVKPLLHTL